MTARNGTLHWDDRTWYLQDIPRPGMRRYTRVGCTLVVHEVSPTEIRVTLRASGRTTKVSGETEVEALKNLQASLR